MKTGDMFVSRNNALRFAAFTRDNLLTLERAKEAGETVHLVTQLVNSLFGLVVFAWERNFIEHIKGERLTDLQAQGWPEFRLTTGEASTLGHVLRHLRNSFAHGRLSFSSDSANPVEVIITIEDKQNKNAEANWCANISAADLRAFCFLFADLLEKRIG